jgi:uncharacterized membrane protein
MLGSGIAAPMHIAFTRSGDRGYGAETSDVEVRYDVNAKTLWATKAADMTLIRLSGYHRDFPFDSARFDFDLSSDLTVPINNFMIRNRNPSFDVVCSTFRVRRLGRNTLHLSFEARRNPVVQLTAVVLVAAGLLFLIGIVVFVKKDSLPTAVASFFFSLWSIRAILSSEMKTFPTLLDLSVLSLCVLLLVALGVRLALREIRSPNELLSD